MNSHHNETDPKLAAEVEKLSSILAEMSKVVVGQAGMNRSMLVGLLTGGHVLLEGLPGLAKTLAIKTLAQVLDVRFHRVQFTPDLLPSDLIGTMIYREQLGDFIAKKGPIFCNILLADEINRAPAKVQSALLEAMAERQVTIGETSYTLEEPFLVLATQNPIEQEGTYPLPEAQLDRFMLKLKIEYPTRDEEREIMNRMSRSVFPVASQVASGADILHVRRSLENVYLDERIQDYILRLVMATRRAGEIGPSEVKPEKLAEIRKSIQVGASPRASLALNRASRAIALLSGRSFVIPDDVKAIAAEVLRHRLILTFEAEAQNITSDDVVTLLLDSVAVP